MDADGFSFPPLPPPRPLANQNPLLQKATVVDTSSAPGSSGGDPSAAVPSPPISDGSNGAHAAATTITLPVPPGSRPARKKVPFEKGFSQMDWIRKTQSGADLSGLGKGNRPRKDITLQEVAQHKTMEDGWTVLRGKVYNLTPYLKFHPGGDVILKAVLGKDGTALFNKYHAWVNAEFLLEKCLVGTLAPVPIPA